MALPKVSVSGCSSYKREEIESSLDRCIDRLGGWEKFLKKEKTVLLKPNLLMPATPDKAATTHPEIIRAVIKAAKKRGCRVIVGDSPGGKADFNDVAKKTGVFDVCKKEGAELVELNRYSLIRAVEAKVYKEINIDKTVRDADVLINMPKLKTHVLTTLTGAVKNLYGCIPGDRKSQLHMKFPSRKDFSEMLLDIYSAVRPALNIVDGIEALEGNGPSNGSMKKAGLIIAGEDAVCVDAACAKVMGIPAKEIETLYLAKKRGMIDSYEPDILGDSIKSLHFRRPAVIKPARFVPGFMKNILSDRLMDYPFASKDRCVGCRICADSCPPGAITIKDKKAVINDKICIRCYCCHELCPHDAIRFRKSMIGRGFSSTVKLYQKIKGR